MIFIFSKLTPFISSSWLCEGSQFVFDIEIPIYTLFLMKLNQFLKRMISISVIEIQQPRFNQNFSLLFINSY